MIISKFATNLALRADKCAGQDVHNLVVSNQLFTHILIGLARLLSSHFSSVPISEI